MDPISQGIDGGIMVNCDNCNEPFDEDYRVPTILPDCAHTLCSLCVRQIIEENEFKECPLCQVPIDEKHNAEDFKINYKLLNLLTNPSSIKLFNVLSCYKHPGKPIEYFCKACSLAVCVKCIYDEHNGHNLV